MPPPLVTIIGAGLSGLTLGQSLKNKGIRAVLYDSALSAPRHNYGITLHSWAYRHLLALQSIDSITLRQKLSVNSQQRDPKDSEALIHTDFFRCNRGRLEALLSEGLTICWAKKLRNVRRDPDSKYWHATFEDGHNLATNCIIGCDGAFSTTREKLYSRASPASPSSPTDLAMQPQVLPYAVYNGRRRISNPEDLNKIRNQLRDAPLVAVLKDGIRLEISVNDYGKDYIDLSYTYSRPAHPQSHPGTNTDNLFHPGRARSDASNIPNALYEEIATLQDLSLPFDIIFNASKVRNDRVLNWLMRVVEPQELPSKMWEGVALIGDAMHATPILGGDGANMAVVDGVELAEWIAEEGGDDLGGFMGRRWKRWGDVVARSVERIAEMHGMKLERL